MNNLTKNTIKNSSQNVVEFHNKRKEKKISNDKPDKKVKLVFY